MNRYERPLYAIFHRKFMERDPKAWIYKIPDTGKYGGKKPFDTIVVSLSVPMSIEFKATGDDATKYQAYQLKKFEQAGGISASYNLKDETHMDKFVDFVISCRDEFIKDRFQSSVHN